MLGQLTPAVIIIHKNIPIKNDIFCYKIFEEILKMEKKKKKHKHYKHYNILS